MRKMGLNCAWKPNLIGPLLSYSPRHFLKSYKSEPHTGNREIRHSEPQGHPWQGARAKGARGKGQNRVNTKQGVGARCHF